MNKALIERTIAAMDKGYMPLHFAEYKAVMEALKEELAKPELDKPEPVAYRHGFDGYGWLYTDNGDGSSWRDNVPTDAEPLYAAPTEPNCKFPTCHSQEYQNKLVQEILGQEPEPYAWVFVPHNELLWPDEVEHKTPCEATGYIPLYTKGTTNV